MDKRCPNHVYNKYIYKLGRNLMVRLSCFVLIEIVVFIHYTTRTHKIHIIVILI